MEHADRGRVLGRATELARLDELVAALEAGQGGLAWLQGEPGIGKTALVDTLIAGAADGITVFRAAGDELMQPFPLRLMAECLRIPARPVDAAAANIADLLRGESGSAGTLDPVMTAAERMLELVDRACAAGPVILVTEDLHWADEPSMLVWGRLARAVDQIPLLLIGTARPLPARADLARLRELAAQRAATILDLAPLGPADTARLAGRIAGGMPGSLLTAAAALAGGNPLYVRELVESLRRAGLIDVTGGAADLRGDPTAIPESLQVAIGSRLGFLSDAARATLRIAALLGNEFDVSELAAVTGEPVSRQAQTLTDAVTGGVLTPAGSRLRFRHELIHQALVEETPEAIRVGLHAEFAATLARAGGSVDAVARHLLAVPGRLDPWALDWLASLPEATLYAMPQVSADLLTRAAKSADASGEPSTTLATRLALAMFWLGRNEEARRIAAGVIRRTSDRSLGARMRILAIRASGRLGYPADSQPWVLASPADDDLPPRWHASLAAWSAKVREVTVHGTGLALASTALAEARGSGDPLAIGYAEWAMAGSCRPDASLGHVQAALAAVLGGDPDSMEFRGILLSSELYEVAMGYSDTSPAYAEAKLSSAVAIADQAGTYLSASLLATAAVACYRLGQWDAAMVHLGSIDPQSAGAGPDLAKQHSCAALIALRRDDRPAAAAELRAALAFSPAAAADPPEPVGDLTDGLARQSEADGDLARALSLMSRWLDAEPGNRPRHREDNLHYLVRLALAAGDRATAEAAVATCKADLTVDGSIARVLVAALCQAMVDGDGDVLLGVAARYGELGWLTYQAESLEEAAACLAAAGDAERARAALTDAVGLYAGMGATLDIRRTDARLRAHGIRRGPRSAHRRARTGWDALTPSEVTIAGMVARGMSNPDIAAELYLSRRTVQTHVSSILGKLGLRSRMGIGIALADQATRPTD